MKNNIFFFFDKQTLSCLGRDMCVYKENGFNQKNEQEVEEHKKGTSSQGIASGFFTR